MDCIINYGPSDSWWGTLGGAVDLQPVGVTEAKDIFFHHNFKSFDDYFDRHVLCFGRGTKKMGNS